MLILRRLWGANLIFSLCLIWCWLLSCKCLESIDRIMKQTCWCCYLLVHMTRNIVQQNLHVVSCVQLLTTNSDASAACSRTNQRRHSAHTWILITLTTLIIHKHSENADLRHSKSGLHLESVSGVRIWTPDLGVFQNLMETSLYKGTSLHGNIFVKIRSVVFTSSC